MLEHFEGCSPPCILMASYLAGLHQVGLGAFIMTDLSTMERQVENCGVFSELYGNCVFPLWHPPKKDSVSQMLC